MNTVILMGRLVKDPEVRYTQEKTAIARYRIAVDRRFKKEGQQDADFFDCVAFGHAAEFVEKYFHQGSKILVQGRIQNNNYKDKEGKTVYGNQIVVESQEFAESKGQQKEEKKEQKADDDGFMVPEGVDEELPFE